MDQIQNRGVFPIIWESMAYNSGLVNGKTELHAYFIDFNNGIIYNPYDCRGADIVSLNLDVLRPIYIKFYNWILEFNLEEIKKLFEDNIK